ncbi:uncharacterized protein [Haliotis cracherodii]|uniref:uncharacterized protein n=1 Tax=Haliotis cracherodii TaxID=6455 RepID=UPI0039ED7354
MADQEKNGVNIANGVTSGLVLACGAIYSALSGIYIDSVLASVGGILGITFIPLWSIGFAYIVPGLLGLLATCTKAKCAYITQMVFCILTLLVMGIFVIIALLSLTALSYVADECQSSSSGSCSLTSGSFYAVLYSISISMVLGWVLTLVITILGGMLACRRRTTQGQVMVPMTQMTVVSGSNSMQPMGHMTYPNNSAYTQSSGYPDNRAYTQSSGYPDNKAYTQGTDYPDNMAYTQGTDYPDNWAYTQGTGYSDNRAYTQGTGYPDNRAYMQDTSNPAYMQPSGYQSSRQGREKY